MRRTYVEGGTRNDRRLRKRCRSYLISIMLDILLSDSEEGHVLEVKGGQALAFKMKASLPSIQFPEHPGNIEASRGICAS